MRLFSINVTFNMSFFTNFISALVFAIAYLSPEFPGRRVIAEAGLYALSGAFTNWMAVYMLFEKVPYLYGSGVIEMRFEAFKKAIRGLILQNFFTEKNFAVVAKSAFHKEFHFEAVIDKVDFDDMFDGFVNVVQNASYYGIVLKVTGKKAMEPLRQPFKAEFRQRTVNFLDNLDVNSLLENEKDFGSFREKVELMIDTELERLTPLRVKQMVEQMIREHMGWLVVWGGVFGALMGIASALLLK